MRYFLDTEFDENGKTIDLISLAIVREDGTSLYLVSGEFNERNCSAWVQENVLPHIAKQPRVSRSEIAYQVRQFVADDPAPEFWAYFADYDWVVLCQLFGRMLDLPKNFPMFCMDLKQWAVQLGVSAVKERVPRDSAAHDALADALWNRDVWRYLADRFYPRPALTALSEDEREALDWAAMIMKGMRAENWCETDYPVRALALFDRMLGGTK